MNELKRTRIFNFPNGGHSVRKLCESLKELGDTRVKLEIVRGQYEGDIEMSFVEVEKEWDSGQFIAKKLAKKLKTLGTRFVVTNPGLYINGVEEDFFKLRFRTNFSDIQAYPKFYGVL